MRIKSYPTQPHISIAAAQAYVRLASGRSKDLRAKMNAQKTLSQLQDLYAPPAIPAQLTGPEPILSQFVEMQMGGIGLTQDGSAQVDAFLVHPAQEPRAKVGVARAYVVKKASVALNKADAYVEYGALGELDSQLRLTSSGAAGSIVRQQ